MRKTAVAALVALILTLALASTALAVDLVSSRHPDGSPPGDEARMTTMSARAHFVPLGVKLAGTAVINGQVRDFGNSLLPGAYVAWAVTVGPSFETGDTMTDGSGLYSFSGLPAATGNGELFVGSPSEPWGIGRYDASWADPGPTSFDFRPGVIMTVALRGGPWNGWSNLTTYLYGSDALSGVAGMSTISSSDEEVSGYNYAAPGTYGDGVAYFWMDEGIEFSTNATITAGDSSGQTIVLDQANAQRIYVTAPYWASGKPGTSATVKAWNYPAGWPLDYYGYADSPSGTPFKDYSDLVTTGASPFTKSLTIPSTAPAGYWYLLGAYNTSGYLDLATPFQVCTLKSSKTAVKKGGSIKLSGVIPTEGHWGSQAGKSKYVTIYKRTKSVSAAPTVWDPTTKGWTKVARVKANGLGKYASAYLKPSRTTWYVVRYPGDNWYWGAYTSVLKVRVY
jgi:hypothetical protein